jgi:fatty acid-binding protein DegV
VAKARGRKQSLRKVVELALDYAKDSASVSLSVAHGNALQDAKDIKAEMISQLSSVSNVFVGPVSPALGVHTGPGLIGVCVHKD